MMLQKDESRVTAVEVDMFYILDLDRCLVDSDRLHRVLEELVARLTPITVEEVRNARQVAERRGETFDTTTFIHKALTNLGLISSWPRIRQQFINEAKTQDMLEPYARDLLAILDKKRLPYGILTYGVESWQLIKLEACDLITVPFEITAIKEKGRLLRGWKHSNGYFTIPPALCSGPGPLIARSLTFLDDKAISFQDIPGGVRGIRVKQLNRLLLSSQLGPLPPGILEVEGILEAIRVLFKEEYSEIIDKT